MKFSEGNREQIIKKLKEIKKKVRYNIIYAKDWILANKKIAFPAGAVIIILLIGCFTLLKGAKGTDATLATKTEGSSADVSEGIKSAIPVPEAPLEENAYPEVNSLMAEYFGALSDGDVEKIKTLKSYIDAAEEIRIEKKSEFIEEYQNITCYTKIGPLENSYLVYVYVEAKFADIETTAPGLYSYFVCKNDEGCYWILDGELDSNATDYFKVVSSQADVEDLFNRVKVKYADAVDSDEDLKVFVEELPDKLQESVGVALAALEEPATTEEAETKPEVEEETPAAEETVQKYVKTLEVVNVRSSDSETADKLGKAQADAVMMLYENKANGWSKVQFEGKEAYIKTEFLAETEETQVSQGVVEETPQPTETSTSSKESVKAKTTVNVRASANENGERLGTIYQGEVLELLMKQADGWSKVKYKGQTGYVKSEFME